MGRSFQVSHRRSRKRSVVRTIPVRGEGDDSGRYFTCWYCGFVCDIQKDALDDGKPGINVTAATLPPGMIPGDLLSVSIRVGEPIILRSQEDVQSVYRERSVTVSSGCPGCGRHNWKT